MKTDLRTYKVVRKQKSGDKCIVCGFDNDTSMKLQFYVLEDNSICAIFNPSWKWCSYEGRLHGGIISTLLDETIGRAIQFENDELFGVTTDLRVKFLKPTPYDRELFIVGKIVSDIKRIVYGSGYICDSDGTIYAHASGKFLQLDVKKIAEVQLTNENWKHCPEHVVIKEFTLPDNSYLEKIEKV